MREALPACVLFLNLLGLKLIVKGYNTVMGSIICSESTMQYEASLHSLLNEKITTLCIILVSMQCRKYDR